jgi:hypothetical protein
VPNTLLFGGSEASNKIWVSVQPAERSTEYADGAQCSGVSLYGNASAAVVDSQRFRTSLSVTVARSAVLRNAEAERLRACDAANSLYMSPWGGGTKRMTGGVDMP